MNNRFVGRGLKEGWRFDCYDANRYQKLLGV